MDSPEPLACPRQYLPTLSRTSEQTDSKAEHRKTLCQGLVGEARVEVSQPAEQPARLAGVTLIDLQAGAEGETKV